MIESIISKLILAPISFFNIFVSKSPRPFSLLELSILLWGVCFATGWYITMRRVEWLYIMEGYVQNSKNEPPKNPSCFEDKKNVLSGVAWMLEVDNKVEFFFKALYWFSFAYLHSLFVFFLIAIFVYTYMLFSYQNSSIKHTISRAMQSPYIWNGGEIKQSHSTETFSIPAIVGMRGIFSIFDQRFILLHVTIFVVAFLAFYAACIFFLSNEGTASCAQARNVNRNRFKYLLHISYLFVDTCYMIFYIILMTLIKVPKGMNEAMDKIKVPMLRELFTGIGKPPRDAGFTCDFKGLKDWIYTQTHLKPFEKNTLIAAVTMLHDRDSFCKSIICG